MLRVAAIGYKNHAKRIIDIVNSSNKAKVELLYHPEKSIVGYNFTNNLDELKNFDAIFILSPNETHFNYLEFFSKDYTGYIFCEKPPVTKLSDLRALKTNPLKTFFNFNLRYSDLASIIQNEIENNFFGKIIHCQAIVTHGLAHKESYRNSWRSNKVFHLNGISETVSIHYLDLFSMLFGKPERCDHFGSIHADTGSAFDSSMITSIHDEQITSSIFSSYAGAYNYSVSVIGTNGKLSYDGKTISLSGPRDFFDHQGNFSEPPVVRSIPLIAQEMWHKSLEISVNYFLKACSSKIPFSNELYNLSLKSCESICIK